MFYGPRAQTPKITDSATFRRQVTWGLGNFHGATLENGAGPVVISGPVASVADTDRGFAALMVDGSVTTWGSGEDGGQVSTAVANELTGNVISVHSFHKFIHGSHGRSQHFIARKSLGMHEKLSSELLDHQAL